MIGADRQGPARRRRPRPGDRTGQVLVVVLLGILLLGGLVFYVVNAGVLQARRTEMQNAADAAVISGAAWLGRSGNVVGQNNVAITRMLALLLHLDAFPLSARMGHEETAAWVQCLRNQIGRGVPDSHLRQGLESLHARMDRQRLVLEGMDNFFTGFDVARLTTWNIRGHGGQPPHGELWVAAETMDVLSQAAAESAGVLAQVNAVRYGALGGAEAAFVVPIVPELPHQRATFNEFESAVKRGLPADRVWPQRLGPYDRLFKWRDYQYRNITEPGNTVLVRGQPGHGPIRGNTGGVNPGGRQRGSSARGYTANPNDRWVQTSRTVGRILLGYTVYGPFEWMRRQINGYAQGHWGPGDSPDGTGRRVYLPGQLSDTFFHEYHQDISTTKLGYMWGSQNPKFIHYPQWRTDYPTARALAHQSGVRVTRTMYYLVEVRSKHPKGSPLYLSPGTFKTNGDLPIAMWLKGWRDAADWKIPLLAEWIWEDKHDYETTEDWDIGIRKEIDPATGQPRWQKVYMISQYVFGGADVGGDWEITNPANYTDRAALPAPLLIDISMGDYDMSQPHHDLGVRRQQFTLLGVARKNNRAEVWARRFGSGNPSDSVVAVAQAEIFNTTSWDLWTQDWKVKLVPVTRWTDWMTRMQQTAPDAARTRGMVSPDVVFEVNEYLSRFTERMVNEMMQH